MGSVRIQVVDVLDFFGTIPEVRTEMGSCAAIVKTLCLDFALSLYFHALIIEWRGGGEF